MKIIIMILFVLERIRAFFFSQDDKGEPYFKRYDKDNPDISDYINNRLESRIKWYDDKAKVNMNRFNILQILTLGFSALIPIVNVIDGLDLAIRIISSLLGGLIAIITGILQLSKAQESWLLFRSTAENLIREYNLYMLRTGEYSEDNIREDKKRNNLFIDKCEAIMSNEGTKYLSLRQQQQQQQQQESDSKTER